ncbi:indole-3-glycerol phosphate synthase [Helicobacter sp.]|uniref:indole-3-glycerol phosphate synthase n=1 Tax=Helicobacter sp. TaxID=218 RepID=UPI0025BDDA2D|nr:indole-3-glycerol phosphate synthase [Helicobacter sp.]
MKKENMILGQVSKEALLCAKENLKMRKASIDFDTLGRTLAYSPYLPRIRADFFARQMQNEAQNDVSQIKTSISKEQTQHYTSFASSCPQDSHYLPKIAKRIILESHIEGSSLLYECAKLEENAPGNFDAYMLDFIPQYTSSRAHLQEHMLLLESISLLRRHSTLPIIYADIFLESYQILESALFGADMLFIPAAPIEGKTLKELLHFAWRLECDVIVAVSNKDELKKAIFSGATMLFIPQDYFKELLSLVPNTQIIATNHPDEYGVDVWIRD